MQLFVGLILELKFLWVVNSTSFLWSWCLTDVVKEPKIGLLLDELIKIENFLCIENCENTCWAKMDKLLL